MHYEIWKTYTEEELKPQKIKVFWYTFLAFVFGFTFAVKLMENGEGLAQEEYEKIAKEVPDTYEIKKDEEEHEAALLDWRQSGRWLPQNRFTPG